MPIKQRLFTLALAAWLAGCNGTSGDNGDDPFGEGNGSAASKPVIALKLAVLDANCDTLTHASFGLGDKVCVQARVTQDGTLKSGEIVNFTAGLGKLSTDSKLTDTHGIAQITLSSGSATAGAATITATVGETSAQTNYEFLATTAVVNELPELSLSILNDNGDHLNRFKAGQQVVLRAKVEDQNDQPLANTIVQFQVGRGTLVTSDALTNSQGIAEVLLSGTDDNQGAAVATAQFTLDDQVYINSLNYEIQSADAVDEIAVKFGYFNGDKFEAGKIGTTFNGPLSAGGTLGLSVALVTETSNDNDEKVFERIQTPTSVTFNSICAESGDANIDRQVITANGEASTTYQDIRCATGSGNTDTISASITVNNSTMTIIKKIELLPEDIGALEFVSAQPQSIVLLGTGGQGSESISTVTFQVAGELGNPLAQQQVYFSLNSKIGGLTLSPAESLSNSLGQVSTRVTAGHVPTAVRVTAATYLCANNGEQQQSCSRAKYQACNSAADCTGTTIRTQSDQLTVNTGLPDQNSFSLSTSNHNPEAFNIDGQKVTITARLADSFNNPVADGTAVAFTAEGGSIDGSCVTNGGACSVTWISANPRPTDHRITILATAVGHETLVDSNGNNVFDNEDGGAITDNNGSGLDISFPSTPGFVDLAEAWRDDDEDGVYNATETFLDFNVDGIHSARNNLFDGPQCRASDCGSGSLHVRKALVMIMSSSSAIRNLYASDGKSNPATRINRGSSASYRLAFSDTAGQPIASGSTVRISTTAGTLGGATDFTMPKTNTQGITSLEFTLANELEAEDSAVTASITLLITSPSGVESALVHSVELL